MVKSALFQRIDHMAIAVSDLEKAREFYENTLGMTFVERRETSGKHSGMRSVVLSAGSFQIVLIEGTNPESQVSRYIERYGPGVQHVAFEVSRIEWVRECLESAGMQFSTNVLESSGLKQVFSARDEVSGMMFELIERTGETGFKEENINRLFEELEQSDRF